MAAKDNRKQNDIKLELLTEESKRTLISYHMMQLKRDHLINPAQTAVIPLLDLLDDVRSKWKLAEDRLRAAEERAERVDRCNARLTEDVKERRERERELNGQISMLKSDKKELEELIMEYGQRFTTMKRMIHQNLADTVEYDKIFDMRDTKKLTFADKEIKMETSELDKSADEVRLRFNRGYRRSRSVNPDQRNSRSKRTRNSNFDFIDEEFENNENDPFAPEQPKSKRSRDDREGNLITTVTTITMDASGKRPTRGSIEVHKSTKKRSVSASRILDDNSARRRLIARSPRIANAISTSELRHKTPTGIGSSWTRGRAIAECLHKFSAYRTLLGSCAVCNRQTTFISKNLQCEYCKICVHDQCKKRAPVPCLPASSFPTTPGRNNDAKLALPDYCPVNPPFIPALLIRCICALEKDRLNMEGIYRVPGSKEDVMRLYKEFSKFIPNLTLEPTEVITSCIKMFLRRLKEPLIPRSSYTEFMRSADDDEKLIESIGDLPETNRDTLAYLCLHLQKVATNSSVNKMPVENLALSLCPTILSNSSSAPQSGDPYEEAARQRFVLERLLKMPAEFWSDYLNARTVSKAFSSATPTTHHVILKKSITRTNSTGSTGRADNSILGPISSTPPLNFTPKFQSSHRIKEPLF